MATPVTNAAETGDRKAGLGLSGVLRGVTHLCVTGVMRLEVEEPSQENVQEHKAASGS